MDDVLMWVGIGASDISKLKASGYWTISVSFVFVW